MVDLVGVVDGNDAVGNIPKISVIITINKTSGEINKLNKFVIITLHTSLTSEHNLRLADSFLITLLCGLTDLGGFGEFVGDLLTDFVERRIAVR